MGRVAWPEAHGAAEGPLAPDGTAVRGGMAWRPAGPGGHCTRSPAVPSRELNQRQRLERVSRRGDV